MKKVVQLLALTLITTVSALAQTQNTGKMKKKIINPWQWQDKRSYVQAVEVKHVESTLYVSGQTAISADGVSGNENMETLKIELEATVVK